MEWMEMVVGWGFLLIVFGSNSNDDLINCEASGDLY